MAAKRGRESAQQSVEAETKLTRLLDTETELETMLEEARERAREIVSEARERASRRLGELERELERQDTDLEALVARERDETIATIRADAKREIERLNDIPEGAIAEIARSVLDRLLDGDEAGVSP